MPLANWVFDRTTAAAGMDYQHLLVVVVVAMALVSFPVVEADCNSNQFACNQPQGPSCIPKSYFCDGYADCFLGVDELPSSGCTKSPTPPCDPTSQPHWYRCVNESVEHCIKPSYLCDGISDCRNGDDEKNCNISTTCSGSQFKCNRGLCVPDTSTCDGTWNCRDGSDESTSGICDPNACSLSSQLFCNLNQPNQRCINMTSFCTGATCSSSLYQHNPSECDLNICLSGSCPQGNLQVCTPLKVGYQCSCRDPSMQMDPATKICSYINYCGVTPWVCDQMCTSLAYSQYNCSCAQNYTLYSNGSCVRKSAVPAPYLMFGGRYSINTVGIDGSNLSRLNGSFPFVYILAVFYQSNSVYFFDASAQSLNTMFLDGTNFRVLDTYYTASVEGIAIDSIARKLYYTSTILQGIYVSELNGSFTRALISGVSSRCRGVAVHPTKGWVFWTDWSSDPFIGRIGMDGTQFSYLVTQDMAWPNGISVDYDSDHIFWVDALKATVEYTDINGNYRHVLSVSSAYISQPYGISVFENTVYWSDWNYKSIFRADKWTGNNTNPVVRNLSIQPFDVRVLHPLLRLQGPNPCGTGNGGCSHLCLISPGGSSYKCACPGIMQLNTDNKTCNTMCSRSQFKCTLGDVRCIPLYFMCDGKKHCIGGEDEFNCEDGKRYCGPEKFQCSSTNKTACFDRTWVCDGYIDCPRREDELSTLCSSLQCQPYEFQCVKSNRGCIPIAWQCDYYCDCFNCEDEQPFNPACSNGTSGCLPGNFRCASSGACIPQSWYCDSFTDCSDRSDEPDTCWQYRANNPCSDMGLVMCPKSYQCINRYSLCDGTNDCGDNSDENPANCLSCPAGQFQCANKRCIPNRWVCDCDNNCNDNSDENVTMCVAQNLYRTCTASEFQCDGCRCIGAGLVCNGNNDCKDGTDEQNCACNNVTQFKCSSGQCIDKSLRCNRQKDCINDNSDEVNCPAFNCSSTQFQCNSTKYCIPIGNVCNGYNDCDDGSDENPNNCLSCAADEFQCTVLHQCIKKTAVCDGVVDCSFGGDEVNCVCNQNQFQCNSSKCIDQSLYCNYVDDCGDMSDEANCSVANCSSCVSPSKCDSRNVCTCPFGYIIDPRDTRTCTPFDECNHLSDNWCPQKCSSTYVPSSISKSVYTCSCVNGFIDNSKKGTNCQPADGLKGTLLLGRVRSVQAYNLTSQTMIAISSGVKNADLGTVASIDVDSIKSWVYWVSDRLLWRAAIPKDNSVTAVPQSLCSVNSDASGVAVDWSTGNVFWTERTGGVYVTTTKFVCARTKLISATNNMQPISIVVNPFKKSMYFIDANQNFPKIMTASLAGNNLTTLVGRRLYNPSGLTIDYIMNGRIFWADFYNEVIESCMADGSDRIVLIPEGKGGYPYMLDVFAGTLYWTTDDGATVKMAPNLGQGSVTDLLSQQAGVGPLRLSHPSRYGNIAVSNDCTNNACNGICLQDASGVMCLCPDGVQFRSGSTVECDYSPFDNMTATSTATTMSSNQPIPTSTTTTTPSTTSSTTTTSTSTTTALNSSTPGVTTTLTTPGTTSSTTTTSTSTTTALNSSTPGVTTTLTTPGTTSSTTTTIAINTTATTTTTTTSTTTPSTTPGVTTNRNSTSSTTTTKSRSTTITATPMTPVVSPTTTTTAATTTMVQPLDDQAGQGSVNVLAIVLPIVLGILLIIVIVAVLVWLVRRGIISKNRFQTLHEDTGSIGPVDRERGTPYTHPVAFDGQNVNFENRMFDNDPAHQGYDNMKKSLPDSKEMAVPDDNFINQMYDFEPAGATNA